LPVGGGVLYGCPSLVPLRPLRAALLDARWHVCFAFSSPSLPLPRTRAHLEAGTHPTCLFSLLFICTASHAGAMATAAGETSLCWRHHRTCRCRPGGGPFACSRRPGLPAGGRTPPLCPTFSSSISCGMGRTVLCSFFVSSYLLRRLNAPRLPLFSFSFGCHYALLAPGGC